MADFLVKPLELSFTRQVPSHGADPDKVIIIYHGITANKNEWIGIAKKIADQTKRMVYCFDLRDHGDSPWSDEQHGQFTRRGIVSDLVNFLKSHDIEKATLIGHSLGGENVSALATFFPDLVEKLILVDVTPKTKPEGLAGVRGFLDSLHESLELLRKEAKQSGSLDLQASKKRLLQIIADKDEKSKREYVDNLIVKDEQLSWVYNLDGLYTYLDANVNTPHFTPSFDGPVLVVHAEPSAFVDDYDYVRSMMPNVEFSPIANGEHTLHQSNPEELLARIVSFVNKTNETGDANEGSDANETDE